MRSQRPKELVCSVGGVPPPEAELHRDAGAPLPSPSVVIPLG